MRFVKKLLAVVLTVVLALGLFTGVRAEASETCTPKISLKYVNDKTGVKITIGKTVGAEAYRVYLKGCGDSYADYWSEYAKNEWREIALIEKNGKAKRTYTINGLPKGTYSIKVAALMTAVVNEWGDVWYSEYEGGNSAEKTVKIKAPSKVKAEEITFDFSKAKVGDTITFGSYEQDGIMTNGKEDIEWIVLSKNKSQMLVISRYALDCLSYNAEDVDMTWETCTLRKWLNGSFYNTAFTKAERSLIKKNKLENADNPDYGTEGGNATQDKVFLLSLDDIVNTKYGFAEDYDTEDEARRCTPTAYAVAHGVSSTNYFKTSDGKNTCWWWLRSPGEFAPNATYVYYNGIVSASGCAILNGGISVRPAVILNLKS